LVGAADRSELDDDIRKAEKLKGSMGRGSICILRHIGAMVGGMIGIEQVCLSCWILIARLQVKVGVGEIFWLL